MRIAVTFIALTVTVLHVDIYQDRLNPEKSTVVIETTEGVDTITVDNDELNDKLVERVVRRYGKQQKD